MGRRATWRCKFGWEPSNAVAPACQTGASWRLRKSNGKERRDSPGVMTAWETFVANRRELAGGEANLKLVCIDLQPYQTVHACERTEGMKIGGFSDSVFNLISSFLDNYNQRFVAEVEAIEL